MGNMGDIRGMGNGEYKAILRWYAQIHGNGVKRGKKGSKRVQKWVKKGSKTPDFGVPTLS